MTSPHASTPGGTGILPVTVHNVTGRMPVLPVALVCALAPFVTGSCWPGWDFLFDVTPSREHRVEDLRVLAIRLEPASVVFSPNFARDGGDPFTLRVNPVLFDPRGGDIDIEVSLCVASGDFFSPCASIGGDVVRRTVTADANDVLGIVEMEETFTLTHDTIVDLFDAAGVAPTSIGGVRAGVVVNVSRAFDGKRERERAELLFPVEVDPFGAGSTPEIFTESGVADCRDEPEGTCSPGAVDEPVCGNGVVEAPFEQCDPPDGSTCDEGCFAFDFCQAAAAPVCIEPVAVNTRPLITGALLSDDVDFIPDDPPRVDVGGVIELTPGVPRFVLIESLAFTEPETAQPAFAENFCPEGSPGRRTFFECGLLPEQVNQRVYISDQRAELVGLSPDEPFFGNPQFGPGSVGVMFAADTPSGTREPLVLVLSDSDGGMDLALFTLEAR